MFAVFCAANTFLVHHKSSQTHYLHFPVNIIISSSWLFIYKGMCCAVSLWIRSLRMCTPTGQKGDNCHPMSHKVPFNGKRLHHTCPCLPNLLCITTEEGRSKCLPPYSYSDYYL
uniref:Prokineticin 2 n=1 Tax=Sander lucioperca TaxID=283035 RepID=A0A8C9YAK7_SANLU